MLGLVHVALTIIGTPVSGASLNPARAFASAAMSNIWREHWVYWVGPFVGSCAASFLFARVMAKGDNS